MRKQWNGLKTNLSYWRKRCFIYKYLLLPVLLVLVSSATLVPIIVCWKTSFGNQCTFTEHEYSTPKVLKMKKQRNNIKERNICEHRSNSGRVIEKTITTETH